jgi:hypothetical protein
MVWVDGALWEASVAEGTVPVGERVEVVAVDGLHLRVRPATGSVAGDADRSASPPPPVDAASASDAPAPTAPGRA